jgi:HAE1 family hydrophobic/amphiphilic exporter-1
MISDFFIARPVLANVLAILMVVIGAVAVFALPVAQYPDLVPPTVQVTTRYPGASARTVVDTVALPIEQQVNGVEGMIYMQSYSGADGSYSLTVTFKIGADLNIAQVLVQNRVSSALSSLPQAVQAQGVVVQKNSTAILQIVTLTSPDSRYDSLYLANYATIKLKDEIARLPGVGNVVVFGAGQYSMRIWLDPDKMQARGLMPQDVIQALQQQSTQVTAGQIGAPPAPRGQSFQYTLNVFGRLSDPTEFAQVIVKTGRAGEITRLSDVGRVELGAQTYGQVFTLDGRPAAGLAIYQAPGANALAVAGEVHEKMAALKREFPQGLISEIPFDTTRRAIDPRGVQDALRSRIPGARRHPGVPAGLARDVGARDDGAGHHYRRLRGDGGARLHDQFLDPVRDRAGDRHRRGRRDRGGRRRRPQYREGDAGP